MNQRSQGQPANRDFSLLHLPLAVGLTFLTYWAFGRVKADWVVKFTERGWTCHAAVFLSWWSLVILGQKLLSVLRLRALLRAAMPPGEGIIENELSVAGVLEELRAREEAGDHRVAPRFARVVNSWFASRSPKDSGDALRAESDAIWNVFQGQYGLVRVFLWSIPIMGFIGTVIGIGDAVGGFGRFLSAAQDVEQIKGELATVTGGLTTAFDTTYVALILSVGVMLAMSVTERGEQRWLDDFEASGWRGIVYRLPAMSAPAGRDMQAAIDPAALAEAMRGALAQLVPGIEAWKTQAAGLATELSDGLKIAWTETSTQWMQAIERLSGENERLAGAQRGAAEEARGILGAVQALGQQTADALAGAVEKQTAAATKQAATGESFIEAARQALTGVEQVLALRVHLEKSLEQATGSTGLTAMIGEMRGMLAALDPSLRRLASEPVQVQVQFTAAPVAVVKA